MNYQMNLRAYPCKTMNDYRHQSVLLTESIEALNIKPDGIYIDGTFGRGGHSQAISEKLSQQGKLIVFDKDPIAIEHAINQYGEDPRVSICHAPFSDMKKHIQALDVEENVDGILLDLGVSSPQLDDATRGFSFIHDGPLDMRMNPQQGISAKDWIAKATENEIASVLKEYGEERFAKRIARAIVSKRKQHAFTRTLQLAEVIKEANPAWEKNKHPATRSFQAIRIFINQELVEVKEVLEQSLDVLKPGGRLVVISFHSLEDRIVKRFLRQQSKGKPLPHKLPVRQEQLEIRMKRVGGAMTANDDELKVNRRARSAVLRVGEKIS